MGANLPFCLSPKLIAGILNEELSAIPLEELPINNDDTIFSLYQKAFCIAPYLIVKALETLETGRINFPPIDKIRGLFVPCSIIFTTTVGLLKP